MKIGVISDTHDNTPAIVWIIEHLNQNKIRMALHAGDMINPGIIRRFADHYDGHLHFVFGNNDGERVLAERSSNLIKNITCHQDEMRLEIDKKKFFMHHYSSISESIAKSGEFDVCIGGHDHAHRVLEFGKTIFINPGNTVTKDKWLRQKTEEVSSFVILDTNTLKTEKVIVPSDL